MDGRARENDRYSIRDFHKQRQELSSPTQGTQVRAVSISKVQRESRAKGERLRCHISPELYRLFEAYCVRAREELR